MSIILSFFSAVFYMIIVQNLVFTGGYGTSEVIRTAARPRQIVLFSFEISFFSTVTALICRLFLLIPFFTSASAIINIVLFTLILILVYTSTVFVIKIILNKSSSSERFKEKFLKQLGIAAFNTLVLALPFISQKVAYSVLESIGAGLGAGLAFALATWLTHAGMKKIETNDEIPSAFRGVPAVFMYIAILAMAFTGISGKSLFF